MLVLRIYSIFDSKIPAFNSPFTMRSEAEAIRGFSEVANDNGNNICRFAEDYTLFELGTFDVVTGMINALPTPVAITKAISVRKSE